MSELINTHDNRATIRWKLLTGASALALTVYVSAGAATAADSDRPQVWIELGGQLNELHGLGQSYAPPFSSELVADGFDSPLKAQHVLKKGFSEDASISFQPEGSDWLFSAAIRYGRSHGGTVKHQQTPGCPCIVTHPSSSGGTFTGTLSKPGARFSETRPSIGESHTLLDFQAGKDVGLGLFGRQNSATVSVGVRIAQFQSNQSLTMRADPDFTVPRAILKYPFYHHSYEVTSQIERRFDGIGPSLSWNASTPISGNPADGELAIDWGANAALLFGRQRTRGHHQTVGTGHRSRFFKYNDLRTYVHRSDVPFDRSRNVTVPDFGAFAGLSYRFTNAKLSVGYRYDKFLNAFDSGIDTRATSNLTFNGPYASISIGIGD
jgi:iron complex outermembrane recepter protein